LADRQINPRSSLSDYEEMIEESWLHLCDVNKGDVIIDVGAGIGYDTHYFSKKVGDGGRVIAIEAHPQTYTCLKKMCQYNDLSNVTDLHLAVSSEKGKVFIDNPDKHVMSSINTETGIEVDAVTIDDLVKEQGISSIKYLKMNIEGAEQLAIKGMVESIKKVKYICICCHDFLYPEVKNDFVVTKKLVSKFLTDNGFKLTEREDKNPPWITDQVNGVNENFSCE
jgi:FkbM family methyltransferase